MPYQFGLSDLAEGHGLDQLTGELLLDESQGFPVRLTMEGDGNLEFVVEDAGTGSFALQVDVLEIDQPAAIEIPENCDPIVLP